MGYVWLDNCLRFSNIREKWKTLFFDALENLENVEDNVLVRQNINRHILDPLNVVDAMTNEQLRKTFRLFNDLFEYLQDILRPYLRQGVRRTDISIKTKVIINKEAQVLLMGISDSYSFTFFCN